MAEVKTKTEIPAKVESKNGVLGNGTPSSQNLKEVKFSTASDRIKKGEQFAILSNRHKALVDKKAELDKFLIADDGTAGSSMNFKIGNKAFEISNNAVIKELLTVTKVKLNCLVEITEAEIVTFVI